MNDKAEKEIRNYGYELAKTFHEQFAQNYNSHLTLFGTFLGYLGVVVVSYAYIFKETASTNYNNSALTIAFLGAGLLLLSGAGLVTVLAENFRRDQVVVARIRTALGVVEGESEKDVILPIFPKGYDPRSSIEAGKGAWLFWMPDVYVLMYLPFVAFEVMLVVFHLSVFPFTTWLWWLALFFGIGFVFGIFLFPRLIFQKLQRKIFGSSLATSRLKGLSKL